MKLNYLVLISMIFASSPAWSYTIYCEDKSNDPTPFHAFIGGGADLSCNSEDNMKEGSVSFRNLGPGVEIARSAMKITCLSDEISGSYAVVGATITGVFGAELRFASSFDNVCIVYGLKYGAGAEVSAGIMKIDM